MRVWIDLDNNIARYVSDRSSTSARSVADRFGLDVTFTRRRLARLAEAGRIRRVKTKNGRVWWEKAPTGQGWPVA